MHPRSTPPRWENARWGPRSAVVAPLRRGPHGADCAPWGGSAGRLAALGATLDFHHGLLARDCGSFLVVLKRLEDERANFFLRGDVYDGAEQCKAAAFAVHAVLAGGERDIAARADAPLPNREPDQLETFERPVAEVQLRVGEFPRRIALVVGCDLDRHARHSSQRFSAREPPAIERLWAGVT